MISIDVVIENLPTLSESKRATWATNAARVLARGPRRNPAYASALRLRDAITAFEATRPNEDDLISAYGLDWDRILKDRSTFRGFDKDRLVARIIRTKPRKFVVEVHGAALAQSYTTLSNARAAAAQAAQAETEDTPSTLPLAA